MSVTAEDCRSFALELESSGAPEPLAVALRNYAKAIDDGPESVTRFLQTFPGFVSSHTMQLREQEAAELKERERASAAENAAFAEQSAKEQERELAERKQRLAERRKEQYKRT